MHDTPETLRSVGREADPGAKRPDATRGACRWREMVAPYARPDARRAVIQLLNTGLPFLGVMAAMLFALERGLWPALILVVPAAGFLLRLFVIQHDCGHGCFFKSRRLNNLIGRILGVVTLTPYAFWRRAHAAHHASVGNLDRRGIGDVTTLTVGEYLGLSKWQRLLYRLYRNPIVMFGLGPSYLFLIQHRIPVGGPIQERRGWVSVLGTNLGIASVGSAIALTVGVGPFLLAYVPTVMVAASIGVWLFYVQHQFEGTYWETSARWDFHQAALDGSSFYDLPGPLHWMTGNIGYHHIHHLSSKIPNYHLQACFAASEDLQQAPRFGLLDSIRTARLSLWDEERRRLVAFREALESRQPQATSCT